MSQTLAAFLQETTPMKRIIFPALCLAVTSLVPVASALSPKDAKWCQDTAKSFPARQASVQADNARRTELAETAELAGEEWENAESLRNLSAEHAAAADEAKAAYEDAKADFYEIDEQVRTRTSALNADFDKFNKVCVS